MPDTGFLLLSLIGLSAGSLLILFPRGVLRLSERLNRAIKVLDEPLMRYRYIVGLLAFAASYAFFRIALLLPDLRG